MKKCKSCNDVNGRPVFSSSEEPINFSFIEIVDWRK